jgi:hypothetical protein
MKKTRSAVPPCRIGDGERMQASSLPQMLCAMAMVQARSGGLEKYPKANSRDQTQYCDSSK